MRTKWFKMLFLVVVSASTAPFGSFAFADAPPAAKADAHGDLSFLTKALGVNQLELQLGMLAGKKATTTEVKDMGKKMVDKHTALGKQLADLAKQAGSASMPTLTADQQKTYDKVAAQSGAAFDATFKQIVDAGHVDELAMYRDEVAHANSTVLRDLVKARVATLTEAVAHAKAKVTTAPEQDW